MSFPAAASTKCMAGTATSSFAACYSDGRVELARGMVDNFFFEIEHYGAMLNANRTYYLTRSQPPFLTSMFVDVYRASQKDGKPDKTWLERAYTDLDKDYEMWTRDPHLAGKTGLSRYYDSATARLRKPCRMKAASIARSQDIFLPSQRGQRLHRRTETRRRAAA